MPTSPPVEIPGQYTQTGAKPDEKLSPYNLSRFQNWFKVWAQATETGRKAFRRDYEFAEGNGKQWSPDDRQRVIKRGQPALEFNQILPQVEFACGMQRDMALDFNTHPRGFEDVRLAEIANASLKATMDFSRAQRVIDKGFDDGTICGLGVWEVLHTFHDANDLLWGDITISRIHPQAYIYDPWSIQTDFQDGDFMGKAAWMSVDAFRDRHPKYAHLAVPGEWLSRVNQLIGSSDDLGTGYNLVPELWDEDTGRIRVLTLWYKVPTDIVLIVDERTGQVQEMPSKQAANDHLARLRATLGHQAISSLQIITQGATSGIVGPGGMPLMDPAGAPAMWADPVSAQAHIDQLSVRAGLDATAHLQTITRVARRPHWCELVYWQILDQGPSPYRDRKYPFVPYLSRRFADDPESIMGIVRNLRDPQEEYNKRYSNLLAHSNSSSHSGWLNRKAGGASSKELELMGSKPGVVVEYAAEKPEQIHPVEISQGHFTMLQVTSANILRISSINAEMVGSTTQQTVSGRAIQARQAGGSVGLRPRLRTFEDSLLDLSQMVFSRIQQFYPPEKIRRIIGVYEQSIPMGPGGLSLFSDPVTGAPIPEEQIIEYLKRMSETEFDLAFVLQPSSPTERQEQFQTALSIAQLVTGSGRAIGPATFVELVNMSDMPSRLATALKVDSMGPQVMPANPGAQDKVIQGQKQRGGGGGESGNADRTPAKQQAAEQREARAPGLESVGGGSV